MVNEHKKNEAVVF